MKATAHLYSEILWKFFHIFPFLLHQKCSIIFKSGNGSNLSNLLIKFFIVHPYSRHIWGMFWVTILYEFTFYRLFPSMDFKNTLQATLSIGQQEIGWFKKGTQLGRFHRYENMVNASHIKVQLSSSDVMCLYIMNNLLFSSGCKCCVYYFFQHCV